MYQVVRLQRQYMDSGIAGLQEETDVINTLEGTARSIQFQSGARVVLTRDDVLRWGEKSLGKFSRQAIKALLETGVDNNFNAIVKVINDRSDLIHIDGDLHRFRNVIYNVKDITRGNVIIVRKGGIGDLIALTPIFKYLKSRHYIKRLRLLTNFEYAELLHGYKYLDGVIDYPCELKDLDGNADILMFRDGSENVIEKPIIDIFADSIGIVLNDKETSLYLNQRTVDRYNEWLNGRCESNKPKIFIQVTPSSITRCYPFPTLLPTLLRIKHELNVEIILGGLPKEAGYVLSTSEEIIEYNKIVNAIGYTHTALEFAALVYGCDMVIAPDSAAAHMAVAFDMPLVSFWGATTPESRIGNYAKGISLIGKTECVPCWNNSPFPCKNPTLYKTGACYDTITGDEIFEAVKKALEMI